MLKRHLSCDRVSIKPRYRFTVFLTTLPSDRITVELCFQISVSVPQNHQLTLSQ